MKPARRRIDVNLDELDQVLDGARQEPRSVQHPVQFVQVHIDTASGGLHATPPSSSRNRFVNGYPRTCLIDRFGT